MAWVPDAELLHRFAGPAYRFPLDATQLQQDLDDPQRYMFRIVSAADDTGIGHAQLYRSAGGKSARLCRLLIGEPAYRGRGLGALLVRELLHICFHEWQLAEADLNVYEYNTAALQCYLGAGFRETGRSLLQMPGGGTCINIHMHLPRETWETRQEK